MKYMLKLILFLISLLLIGIIFLRTPKESIGLSGLGSMSSAEFWLNILTAFGILIYFMIALKLNFSTI